MSALTGKRIGLLSSWASSRNGGVWTAVEAQARMLRGLGAEPVIAALDDGATATGEFETILAPVMGPGAVGFAPSLTRRLKYARLDLLHLHGIWHYPGRAALEWARSTGRPLVVSPHGMLDRWITGRGRMKKRVARAWWETSLWRAASCFHALTEAEAGDIGREAGRDGALVIANPAPPLSHERKTMSPPHLLYLGRIHPKKNVLTLVKAWKSLEEKSALPRGATLTIAGSGEAAYSADLAASCARNDSITLAGPVHGDAKAALLRNARALILPSLSEGLPMTILEAWAVGTPTVMSEACHLESGYARGAALDSGTDKAAIAEAIGRTLDVSEDAWLAMSRAAQALAGGDLSKRVIAGRWEAAYAVLLDGRPASP
ncbi:glycosyltransferase [Qipengyuania atrilutea]|uniref:Glycosyltransferase n=1 Tax=Qipengyuania atrilutea TaxID=2744473 RepID=A0A850GYU7_9SPHN|nr:glycosyltransferase [Actirhodobacter atriluteus]NVD43547.1 glycosyltransferase [Actirhodobacter atriluteus]